MNFGFTEEQTLLREQLRRFFDKQCPITETRKIMEAREGFSRELWQEMAKLGWLSLIVPEENDGLGLGWIELLVMLEESGRTLFPSPIISHMLAITAIVEAGSAAQKQKYLPAMAEGTLIGSVALFDEANHYTADAILLEEKHLEGKENGSLVLNGKKHFVNDAQAADLFVVAYKGSNKNLAFAIVEKASKGLSISANGCFDKTKREATLKFDNVKVANDNILATSDALTLLNYLLDCGAVAVTAETIGVAEAAHKITVNYANERTQFGSVIGRYQGVKHPLADMFVDIESFKSLCYFAAWCVANDRKQLPRYSSMAKAYASEIMPKLGVDCIKLHGAIGYTAEYDIQLFNKRANWMRPAFGDANFHYDRVATFGGI
jgi:alkylation response protein AidB-like acyl-CoA dehydrogenase